MSEILRLRGRALPATPEIGPVDYLEMHMDSSCNYLFGLEVGLSLRVCGSTKEGLCFIN